MQKNITALYRTHATAELVERELKDLGYSFMSITRIPNRDHTGEAGYDYSSEMDDIHDLYLPENDVRSYQNAIRRGDHLVSVDVEGDDQEYVSQVMDIMRRPEAHRMDDIETTFADADLTPYGRQRTEHNDSWLGSRDTAYDDDYTRVYGRREVLPRR